MTVHHRDDENLVLLDGVQNGKGKNPGQTSTDILFQDRPTLGGFADAVNRSFDTLDEPCAKSRPSFLMRAHGSSVYSANASG